MASDPGLADGLRGVVTALIPIVIGGVTTYFKIFLTSQEEFHRRIVFKRNDLREHLAIRLASLLQHVRSLSLTSPADAPLRGNGVEQPDLVDEYVRQDLQMITLYYRMCRLERIVRHSYLCLYSTMALGLAGVFCAWLVPQSSRYVVIASIGLVSVQVLTIFIVFVAGWKLDDFEDAS